MNRFEVVGFGIFLLIISLFGISDPGSSFAWLMGAHDGLDVLRVSLAMILLYFGTFARRGSDSTIMVFRTSALFMLGLFMGNVLFPNLYRAIDLHILSLDVIALLEGAIVCLLYSINQPLEETAQSSKISKAKGSAQTSKREATKPA